jgi:hypothetical protein
VLDGGNQESFLSLKWGNTCVMKHERNAYAGGLDALTLKAVIPPFWTAWQWLRTSRSSFPSTYTC